MTGRGGGLHIPVSLAHTIAKGQREEGGGRTFPLDHGFHFDCCLNMNQCLMEGGMIAYFEEPLGRERPQRIYPKDMGMTGREEGGRISPLHSIIQLQRDGERRGERREGGISL